VNLIRYKFLFSLFVLMLCGLYAQGQDIYKFVDDKGNFHFAGTPKPGWVKVTPGKKSSTEKRTASKVAFVGPDIKFSNIINSASKKYVVDGNLIAAVIRAESNFDTRAVSRAKAKGLMQLMDATAGMYGVTNVFSPQQNINAGTRHLRNLLDLFDDNITLALAAYNAGQGTVARYGGVPPYKETMDYLARIRRFYGSFEAEISSSELESSLIVARILERGGRYIYRYDTKNGFALSELKPTGRAYTRIDLLSR
jgi:hypothetical protein